MFLKNDLHLQSKKPDLKKKISTQEFGVVVNGSFLLKMVLKVLMGFVLIFCVE